MMAEKRVKRTTTATVANKTVTAPSDTNVETAKPATKSATKTKSEVSSDQIAVAAYLRYVQRGRENGHDVEDWIEAERKLRS
jgi:hypothetical protein